MEFRDFIKKQKELLEGLKNNEMDDIQKIDIGDSSIPVLKRYKKQVSDMMKNDPSVVINMDEILFGEFVGIFQDDLKEVLEKEPSLLEKLSREKIFVLMVDFKKSFGHLFDKIIKTKEIMDGFETTQIVKLFKVYENEVEEIIKGDIDNITKNLTFKNFDLIDLIIEFKPLFKEILIKNGKEFLKNNDLETETIARMIQVIV